MQWHANKYAQEFDKGFAALLLGSHKWAEMVKEITVGTLVLVMDAHAKRHTWPLGLVTSVHRSEDGIVRAVRVRTKCGEGQRPTTISRNVRELIPLTMFDNADECPTPRKSDMDTRARVGIAEMKDVEEEQTRSWRQGRHHHDRPPPWGSSIASTSKNVPGPHGGAASSTGAAISQIANMLFPNNEEAVKATNITKSQREHNGEIEAEERHNTEIKTRWAVSDTKKESKNHKKTPNVTPKSTHKSGSHDVAPTEILQATPEVGECKTVKGSEKRQIARYIRSGSLATPKKKETTTKNYQTCTNHN
jgi:hypothetical protein